MTLSTLFSKWQKKKSLSKAAAEINISQSALSKQMIYLEEYLHKTLLYRSFKGVSLTPDGEITFKYFTKIKAEFQELNDSLNQNHPPVFGSTPAIGMKIHQSALEKQIVHNILLSENIYQLIDFYLSKKIDVLFIDSNDYAQNHFSDTPKDCFTYKMPIYIIVHNSSPLYNQDNVTISDLCKHPCIFYNGTELIFQILNEENILSVLKKNTLSNKYLFEITSFISKNPEYFSFSFINYNIVYTEIKTIELVDVPPRLLTVKMHDTKYKKELLSLKEYLQ